jgi:chromate reductase
MGWLRVDAGRKIATATDSRGLSACDHCEGGTMAAWKIGYIVGSLAKASINRRLAQALVRLAPAGLALSEIPIRDLPIYSYDYDADFPEPARAYKRALEAADALLFVTPEYNRGIPGGLKNAIDWGSRPKGHNAFVRKPSAVIGCSEGRISTAIAQRELHSYLGAVASPQMVSPEAYIQYRLGLIDDEDNVTDEATKAFLQKFLAAFQKFLDKQLG